VEATNVDVVVRVEEHDGSAGSLSSYMVALKSRTSSTSTGIHRRDRGRPAPRRWQGRRWSGCSHCDRRARSGRSALALAIDGVVQHCSWRERASWALQFGHENACYTINKQHIFTCEKGNDRQ
jgi:hypothetical protein